MKCACLCLVLLSVISPDVEAPGIYMSSLAVACPIVPGYG